MAIKKLENLLVSGAENGLEKIIQTAQQMDTLTTSLRGAIEPELAENVVAANVRDDGELVVVCSSSAWASRIRFESEALLRACHEAGFSGETVRVTVSQG